MKQSSGSLVGGSLQSSLGIGESQVKLLGAGNDFLALSKADVVSNFTAVGSVVHEEQFNVFLVVHQELSEAAGKHVSGLSGLLLTNVWACEVATELTAHGVIDTAGSSPGSLNTHKLVPS